MHVDVLVAGMPPNGSPGTGSISRTLLQNISVLSAGQNYQKDAEGKPVLVQVVNLLVTPSQAEILNLATDQRIQLVLRNPADDVITQTTGAATANLFEGSTIHTSRVAYSSTEGPTSAEASGAPRVRRRIDTPAAPAPVVVALAPVVPKTSVIEVLSGGARTQVVLSGPPNRGLESAQ
jgi:pilus assembly protein CpaB